MPRLECPDCKGKGYKIVKEDGILYRDKCPTCKGSGLLPSVFTGERR